MQNETEKHGSKRDPNFQYGTTSVGVALSVLIVTLLVTMISLVLTHRAIQSRYFVERNRSQNEDERRLLESTTPEEDNSTRQVNSISEAADILVTATANAADSAVDNEKTRKVEVGKITNFT